MNRRGSALYLVMLAIVVVSSGSIVIMRAASAGARLRAADRQAVGDDLLRSDAELLAGRWLAMHGRGLTTPLEDPYRPQRIIDTTAEAAGGAVRVTVDAWDACSGVPCDLVDRQAVMALLPGDIRVDAQAPLPLWWQTAQAADRRPFPLADAGERGRPPLALALATWSGRRVNWRTAPWDLVSRVLAKAGRGQLEAGLRMCRLQGREPAPIDGEAAIWPADVEPVLTGETDRWCVLIRIADPLRERSWFEVLSAAAGGARILVRHAVP